MRITLALIFALFSLSCKCEEKHLISIIISLDDKEDKQTHHKELRYHLTPTGNWSHGLLVYNWAFQNWRTGTLDAQAVAKVQALMKLLPASEEKPIPQAQLVRVTADGTLYRYNSGALSVVLKEICELIKGSKFDADDTIKFVEPEKGGSTKK